jgi:hypothetical protein
MKAEKIKIHFQESFSTTDFFQIPLYKQGNIAIKIMIFPCLRNRGMLKFRFDLAVLNVISNWGL